MSKAVTPSGPTMKNDPISKLKNLGSAMKHSPSVDFIDTFQIAKLRVKFSQKFISIEDISSILKITQDALLALDTDIYMSESSSHSHELLVFAGKLKIVLNGISGLNNRVDNEVVEKFNKEKDSFNLKISEVIKFAYNPELDYTAIKSEDEIAKQETKGLKQKFLKNWAIWVLSVFASLLASLIATNVILYFSFHEYSIASHKTEKEVERQSEELGVDNIETILSESIKKEFITIRNALNLYTLTIQTNPANCKIKILNIGTSYKPGIVLKPGTYHIEVSKIGYKTKKEEIQIATGDKIVTISLLKK